MLRLRIVSDQRRTLAERSSAVFSVEGGTIGRSADNDWVLPDPPRYVSAHHARVQFREGHFYLQDVSTNGVYVNDDMEPLAKRGSSGYRLANGDVLRMGEYHIVAALDAPQGPRTSPSAAVPTSIQALRPLRRRDRDIGAPLNLEDLLLTGGGPVLPVSAYGQAWTSGSGARPGAHARSAAAAALARARARRASTAGRRLPPASAPNRSRSAWRAWRRPWRANRSIGNSVMALEDMRSGLEAFCRGAGIAAERLPADAQGRMLHLAGRLFREAFVGLQGSRAHPRRDAQPLPHRDRRRRMRTIRAPRSRSSMVEDLLVALFVQHEGRRLDSVQWLRETIGDAKLHEQACAQATRAAFVEFLDRLDPAELEARFERAARRGKARTADKAQYWELFTTFYRNLIEMPADHLPHTFVEAFAAAYREG